MKKLIVLSAIAVLAACGGSDNKPAGDPSTTSTVTPSGTGSATPAPATTDAKPADSAKPADAPKK